MPGTVIQGFFPNGLGRLTAGQSTQPKAASGPPAWVQQRIAMGQRTVAPAPSAPAQRPVMQRMTPSGSAIELSPNMPRFGNDAGQPLPADVRQKMECGFGTSFADVRIHVGPHAQTLGALALTKGSHIHFAPGQYDPHSSQGQRTLGHELAHVVQQRSGRVQNPFGRGIAIVNDSILEAEADRMARQALARQASTIQRSSSSSSASSSTAKTTTTTMTDEDKKKARAKRFAPELEKAEDDKKLKQVEVDKLKDKVRSLIDEVKKNAVTISVLGSATKLHDNVQYTKGQAEAHFIDRLKNAPWSDTSATSSGTELTVSVVLKKGETVAAVYDEAKKTLAVIHCGPPGVGYGTSLG